MFAASVCSLVMFTLPLLGWRFFNNVMCGVKLKKISAARMYRLMLVATAIPLLPLLALFAFGGGTTLCAGVVAWLFGVVFWFFYH
jgi:hypothetical protein